MNCNIVKDLMPLYIDGCCSKDSVVVVEEHINNCPQCKEIYECMKCPIEKENRDYDVKEFHRISEWKASIMQSILLFFSFAFIVIGVSLEAATPSGKMNGAWALVIIVPATGFMLSLINWYFVRLYKSKKQFSIITMLITIILIILAYSWAVIHYGYSSIIQLHIYIIVGLVLSVIYSFLSRILSNYYAYFLGKE